MTVGRCLADYRHSLESLHALFRTPIDSDLRRYPIKDKRDVEWWLYGANREYLCWVENGKEFYRHAYGMRCTTDHAMVLTEDDGHRFLAILSVSRERERHAS